MFVKPRPANMHQPWICGEVTGRTGPISCNVNTSTGPVRRKHTQIKEAKVEPEEKLEGDYRNGSPSGAGTYTPK